MIPEMMTSGTTARLKMYQLTLGIFLFWWRIRKLGVDRKLVVEAANFLLEELRMEVDEDTSHESIDVDRPMSLLSNLLPLKPEIKGAAGAAITRTVVIKMSPSNKINGGA